MISHAARHHEAGGTLPTRWLGATDTFQSHKTKTLVSVTLPHWAGCWSLRDDGHLAVFTLNGTELVHLALFGVEDAEGMNRLRAECHGLWFEEPAPAAVLGARGMTERAWTLGLTSRRLGSYKRPAIMTLNYPELAHWTWQRFVAREHPGTAYVRIPPGEWASDELRAEFLQALAGQPDMIARLLRGEPASVYVGPQVARGFSQDDHVAHGRRLLPEPAQPIWLGHDGGLTPCTVLAQRIGDEVRILAALASERAGTRQHVRGLVRPWLAQHAPWTLDGEGPDLLYHRYDPSLETGDQGDIEMNPVRVLREQLGGHFKPGAVSWPGRRDPMLAALNTRAPKVVIDPVDAAPLIQALDGRWHYPESPDGSPRAVGHDEGPVKDHPWSDLGDCFCYLLGGMAPLRERPATRPQTHATIGYDVYGGERRTRSSFAASSTRIG